MDTPLDKIRSGTLKLHSLEQNMPAHEAVKLRRNYIEDTAGVSLDQIGRYTIPEDYAVTHNIENMIGCIQIPVGIAGPLAVNGTHTAGKRYIPLATTEGALIASVNRGCKTITESGGADVRILRDGMSRAPVFAARDIVHAAESADWITRHTEDIALAAEQTTTHGKLTGITVYTAGTSVYVRMTFTTGLSMGMNMVTIAAESASRLIAEHTGLKLIASSGNLCCDKKPAAVNLIEGRGKTVTAGVFIPDTVLQSVLKTDAKTLAEVNLRKNLEGSARAGAFGFNAHAANIIAALFLATGQDPAHVVEASSCITTADLRDNGIYFAVTLPSLQTGVLGGGTELPCQRESLSLLGCGGKQEHDAETFAETAAAAVLAGELSLLAALGTGTLGSSHQKHARGTK